MAFYRHPAIGRGRVPVCATRSMLSSFISSSTRRSPDVRAATADAPSPTIKSSPSAATLLQFQTVTIDEVTAAVRILPDKCCLLDPLPPKLLKAVVDLIALFIVEVFSRSLSTGHVPDNFKTAYITPPRLNKSNSDPADRSSHRPISNLSVLSKWLEQFIVQRLLEHLGSSSTTAFCLSPQPLR